MNETIQAAAESAPLSGVGSQRRSIAIPDWGNWAFFGVIVTTIIALLTFGVSWGRIEQRLDERGDDIRVLQEDMKSVGGRLDAVENRLGAVEGRLGVVEGRLGVVEDKLDAMHEILRTLAVYSGIRVSQ